MADRATGWVKIFHLLMFHSFQLKGSGLYIAGSGSVSEEHPVKRSEVVTERLRLPLLPGRGDSSKGVCTELAAIMQQEPGARALYAGPYEENEDAVEVLVFWDSLESHEAMATVEGKMAPVHSAMGPHLAGPLLIHNVAFNPLALATLLEGEVVQMVTIEGVSVDVRGSQVEAIVTALQSYSTSRGVEVGELVRKNKPEKTIVAAVGWQGPVSWVDEIPRSDEWWTKEATKLGPETKIEMHSVKFLKYF